MLIFHMKFQDLYMLVRGFVGCRWITRSRSQTLANCYTAVDQNLEVLPVINKIDLPQAEPDRVKQEIEDMIGLDAIEAPMVSAKTGVGIDELLSSLVESIPSPKGNLDGPLKSLIIDSWFDSYLGVVSLIKIIDGSIQKGQKLKSFLPARLLRLIKLESLLLKN